MTNSELRIGNLVVNPNNGYVCSIIAIVPPGIKKFKDLQFGMYFMQNGDGNKFEASDVSPVLMSKQWLERFGFRQVDQHYHKSYQNQGGEQIFCISGGDLNNWQFFVESEARENHIDIEIRYVHQLQNLYFALTGEELSVKKATL